MNDTEHRAETRRWLRYAREDLEGAETLLERRIVVPRHICWLAQQSVEKAIKAICIFLGLDFPRRHDLDALRNLVPDDWQVKTEHVDLAALTEWAVEAAILAIGQTRLRPTHVMPWNKRARCGNRSRRTFFATASPWKSHHDLSQKTHRSRSAAGCDQAFV